MPPVRTPIVLLLVLSFLGGCNASEAVADELESRRTVPLEQPSDAPRAAPAVAASPAAAKPAPTCSDLVSCSRALDRAKTPEDSAKLRAEALELCFANDLPPRPADAAITTAGAQASLCARLARDEPAPSREEATRLLRRACDVADDGHKCLIAATPLMNSKDALYDLASALPMLRRGCDLGHRASCGSATDVEKELARSK